MQRKPRTHLTYRYTLDTLLRASYKKKYVEDATRDDVLDFMTRCYELGLGARTVYDKVVTVLQLFKKHGRSGLMEKGDWPNYVDTSRPIYEPEELQAMFKAATEDEATLLKFLLGSGFRDQEIRYVEWKDIDFRNHDVRVKAKPHWRFTPKNWEERVVPLPTGLIERLRKRKEARGATPNQLVFPNGRGKPDSEMDMVVKRVAERAKLNCKQCVTEHGNKCAEGPYCMNFFLHKFRHTFATNHLRDGVDIRTVQAWLGHRDIKSTMVYLKGIRSKDAAQKVNSGELAALVAWKTKGKSNYEGSPQMRLFSILRGKTATERPLKV
jgi:integrase